MGLTLRARLPGHGGPSSTVLTNINPPTPSSGRACETCRITSSHATPMTCSLTPQSPWSSSLRSAASTFTLCTTIRTHLPMRLLAGATALRTDWDSAAADTTALRTTCAQTAAPKTPLQPTCSCAHARATTQLPTHMRIPAADTRTTTHMSLRCCGRDSTTALAARSPTTPQRTQGNVCTPHAHLRE